MIDAAPSTINDHIDKLSGWGVITRFHRGRHCEYELHDPAEWRVPDRHRAKSKVSAHCSESRTKDRNTFSVPIRQRTETHKKNMVSQETRAKRANMIKSLRRWSALSPHLPNDERPHRLALLDRCEAQINDWSGRSEQDRQAFELLVARVRARPLDPAVTQSLRQQPRPPADNALGEILKRQDWFRGGSNSVLGEGLTPLAPER